MFSCLFLLGPPGTMANSTAGGCSPCARGGFYQDAFGALRCDQPCPRGMFVAVPGGQSIADCAACPEGTNTSTTAHGGCPCLRGYARPPGADPFSKCNWNGTLF